MAKAARGVLSGWRRRLWFAWSALWMSLPASPLDALGWRYDSMLYETLLRLEQRASRS